MPAMNAGPRAGRRVEAIRIGGTLTEIGTAATGFFFKELEVESCFPGGVSPSEHPDKVFWI